ncbi:MAG: DinB family protein [Acidobacteriia bacterium]|nr:DinB family protein [Terriglobia bacterium]
MNGYGAKELAESFRTVRKNTIVVAEDVPEEKYGFRAFAEGRSVGELLAHIALSCGMQYRLHAVDRRSSFEGFDFAGFIQKAVAEEKQARSKKQVVELLRSNGEQWAGFLEGLSEKFLAERVQMPPGANPASRSRFEMILSVKEHEMHHRGQLMLIERLFGVEPHLTREMKARMAAAGIKI